MGTKAKLRVGDLVCIRTPEFHKNRLDSSLEGKTGVITRAMGYVLPSHRWWDKEMSDDQLGIIYEVLIEGHFVTFNDGKFLARVNSSGASRK